MPLNSQAMIKEKLSDSLDDDVSVTCLRVSLICPIGQTRMTVPSRGGSCVHLQCFDAPTYFKLNEQRSCWRCPVCDRKCPKETLVTDTFLQDILQKDTASTEVVIHKDGSWSTQKLNENDHVLISLEDSRLKSPVVSAFISSTFISEITPVGSTDTNPPEAITNLIDLTVDSSDDDEVEFIRFFPCYAKKNHRHLFKRSRSDPHPLEIQARNMQELSTVDFDNFLIDLGLVMRGNKISTIE